MTARPTIHARSFARAVEMLDAVGADTDALLAQVDLDRASLEDPERRIAFHRFINLYETAASTTRNPHFGLHVGARIHLNTYDALGYAALSDDTVAQALRTLSRYYAVITDGAEVSLRSEAQEAAVSYRIVNGHQRATRQVVELSLAVLLRWMRSLVGDDWSPRLVRFEHPAPASTAEHSRVFGAPIAFGQTANELVFDSSLLATALPTSDPRLKTLMERDLEEALEQLPDRDDFLDAMRRLIADGLQVRHSDIETLARAQHISVRTLQRRLKSHGSNFRTLVDHTRQQLARRYLRESDFTIGEIAFLLGYSEVSAFTHAFHRWCGEGPAAFRRRERAD